MDIFAYYQYQSQALMALAVGGLILLWGLYNHWKWNKNPLMKMRNWNPKKGRILFQKCCLGLAFALMIVSALRPQWGIRQELMEQSGIDLVFALDVSNSMRAIDFSTETQLQDRLMIAKKTLMEFAQTRTGDRLGLVIFAGDAFVASPLTFDHDIFLTFLDQVSPRDVHIQGTNLAEALRVSLQRLQGSTSEEARSRALVLVSDGEETIPAEAAAMAKAAGEIGIPIYTIGIGSLEGVPIPDHIDVFGQISYKQFRGKTVLTELNEGTLKAIAELSGGNYFHAGNQEDLPKLMAHLETLPKSILNKKSEDTHIQRYQWFTGGAFLCFLLFLWLPKGRIVSRKSKSILLLLIGFLLTGCSNELAFKYHLKKANATAIDNPEMAMHLYDKARDQFPALAPITQNNKIRLAYDNEQYHESRLAWDKVIEEYCHLEGGKIDRYCGPIFYNLGNSIYRISEEVEKKADREALMEEAATAYETTLELNPRDKEAWENLAFIRELLNQPPPPPMPGEGEGDTEGGEGGDDGEGEGEGEGEGKGEGEGQGEDKSEDSESEDGSEEKSESEKESEENSEEQSESENSENQDKENQDSKQDQQQGEGQGESQQDQQNKDQENQQNQENTGSDKENQDQKQDQQQQGQGKSQSDQEKQNQEKSESNQENTGSDKENQDQKQDQQQQGQGESQSDQEKQNQEKSESNQENQDSNSENNQQQAPEELPQNIKDYMEQLEQAQQDQQDNFNRNPQQIPRQAPRRRNPIREKMMEDLGQDPFFQEFFLGPQGDPNQPKQFHQDLPQQHEKDW